jgi:hypothetical protein
MSDDDVAATYARANLAECRDRHHGYRLLRRSVTASRQQAVTLRHTSDTITRHPQIHGYLHL